MTIGEYIRLKNFNPRSREGSDPVGDGTSLDRGISIHAPAKGATTLWGHIECMDDISIHAPAKGATYKISNIIFIVTFQSTLPRRERLFPLPFLHHLYKFQSTLPRRERLCDENDSISPHLGGAIPRTPFYRLLPSNRSTNFLPGRLWFAPTKS